MLLDLPVWFYMMPVLAVLWTLLYQPAQGGDMGPVNAALGVFGEPGDDVKVVRVAGLGEDAAKAKGLDVDQPRNLAKSVTVE